MNLPRWHEITAILGGRFDPPHLGHREAVRGLFQNPGVKEVRIIPSATPPHKPATVSMTDRAEMARLNFESSYSLPFPNEVRMDYRELERAKSQPQRPSYSYDTLLELNKELSQPNVLKTAFVLGADQLAQLSTWHRFPDILGLSHWIVLERSPNGGDTARKTLRDWKESGLVRSTHESSTWQMAQNLNSYLTICNTDAPNLSSTQIRESIIRSGTPPKDSLLPNVLGYLKDRKLYGI